jgi:formimidoylglutamate deiminase
MRLVASRAQRHSHDSGATAGRVLFEAALHGGAQAAAQTTSGLAAGSIGDIVALTDSHPSMQERNEDALLDSWIFAGADVVDGVWSSGRKVVTAGVHVAREQIERNYIATLRALRA